MGHCSAISSSLPNLRVSSMGMNGLLRFLNLSRNEFDHLQEPYSQQKLQYHNLHANMLGGQIPFLLSSAFVLDFPSNNFSSIPSDIVMSKCLKDQKHLLLGVKTDFIFNSSASKKLVRWNRTSDCCNWDGVECDGAGRVIGLQLDEESISGGIENSENLFSLGYLEKLNLAHNNFNHAEIPKGLKNLTNLTHLNLSFAGFAGQVPSEILRLRRLVSLDLSSIGITVQLENPSFEMLVQNLTGLTELYLDSVSISAHGREWCQVLSSSLPDLRCLSLRWCNLSGPIDSSLTELRSLSVLRLDGNDLASSVPYFLANFSNLTTLSLAACSLQGTFPAKIFQVPTLRYLDLSSNLLLGGALPQFPPNGSLRTIVLSYTGFSGSIPESISNLALLSRLDLSNCSFTGPMPPAIANLTELDYLDISYNNFTGSIPSFHLSKKLIYLDVSSNRLRGLLSSKHFEGLSNIVYINLGHNLLIGNIPSSLFALPSLKNLQLSNNEFHGQVEEVFNSSTSLLEIDLSSNLLEGPIPKFFSQLERLAVLSLSSNAFNGTVQLEMFNNPNLARLDLSFNNLVVDSSRSNSSLPVFSGISALKLASCELQNFPELLHGKSLLSYLDLSSNQLKGDIPNWIWEIGNGSLRHLNLSFNQLDGFQKPYKFPDSLYVQDLHSNQLQGQLPIPPFDSVYVDYSFNLFSNSIPRAIGHFFGVSFLSVSNNNLTGEIPTSICETTSLAVLDLSSNALTGTIPPCLLNIGDLGVLNLGTNNLSGHIPDVFSDRCRLKTLDLHKNVLEGRVPGSLVNCSSLEVLNIGNNRIEDTFPCMLMETRLHVLILRSNKFHGDLQCLGVMQGWSDLQIIDVSTNKFSSNISLLPFSNWRGMINVDHNEQSQNGFLHFNIFILGGYYYQDVVTVTLKGLELELEKILTIFTSIDFSSNNLSGEIPSRIGDLKSLYLLNISHNALTGTIPVSVGNLRQLGSLDLSFNRLTGKIPVELASLNFLSFLNLSWNKLFGMIPEGRQFQTFSAASFEGNSRLCGFPLDVSCNNEVGGVLLPTQPEKEEIEWGYVSAALGYAVGLGSTVWILLFCRKWREIYFEQVDSLFSRPFPQSHRRRS